MVSRYQLKPPPPPRKTAPPLRVAAVIATDGRTYPVLLDDMLHLFRVSINAPISFIERIGYYKSRGRFSTPTLAFRVIPVSAPTQDTLDHLNQIWKAIEVARKAGASL